MNKKNKTLTTIVFMIGLLPLLALTATAQPEAPELLYTQNFSDVITQFESDHGPVVDMDYDIINEEIIAIQMKGGTFDPVRTVIKNVDTGTTLYQHDTPSNAQGQTLTTNAENGFLIGKIGMTSSSGASVHEIVLYDISNLAFTQFLEHTNFNDNAQGNSYPKITRENPIEFTSRSFTYTWNGTDVTRQATTDSFPNIGTLHNELNKRYEWLVDRENRIIATNRGFYEYGEDGENVTLKTQLSLDVSNRFIDWNQNEANPRYLTGDGAYVLVQDNNYENAISSSQRLEGAKFIYDDDNIIAVNNDGLLTISSFGEGGFTTIQTTHEINESNTIIMRKEESSLHVFEQETGIHRVFAVQTTGVVVELENMNPSIEFLGIDEQDRFVFVGTMTNTHSSTAYHALDIRAQGEATGITTGTIQDIITFQEPVEQDLASSRPNGLGTITFGGSVTRGDYLIDTPLRYSTTTNEYLRVSLKNRIRQEDVNGANVTLRTLLDYQDVQQSTNMRTSMGVYGTNNREIFMLVFELSYSDDTLQITHNAEGTFGTGTFNILTSPQWHPVAGAENTSYFVTSDISLEEQTVYIEVHALNTGIVANTTVNFREPATDINHVTFHQIHSSTSPVSNLLVEGISVRYQKEEPIFPSYHTVGFLSEGERESFLMRRPISGRPFGNYLADYFTTNAILGLDDYENYALRAFTYGPDTPVLSEEEIQQQFQDIAEGEAIPIDPLAPVEGDLITDRFFSLLDRLGIKTAASKFLVGAIIIAIGVGIGFAWGGWGPATLLGLTALFMAGYWQLIPVWMVFSIAILTIVVVAVKVRRAVIGGGGGV